MHEPGERAAPSDVDLEVAGALASGAPGRAAGIVVRALGPGLFGYLVAILRNEGDAREVFSEVAEEVLTSIARFRGESSIKTWTYRIAWRTAMRYREAPERRRAQRLDSGLASELAAEVRASTAVYLKTAAKTWLARMRDELSLEDQSLLTLRVDRELPWSEVAVVMGEGDGTSALARLRKRFERIKERLRTEAEREGLILPNDDRG